MIIYTSLKELLKKILHSGTEYSQTFEQTKRTLLSNQIAILFLSLSSVYSGIFLYMGSNALALLILIFVFMYGVCIFLNHCGLLTTTRVLLLSTINFGIYVFAAVIGINSGIQHVFFPLIIIPIVIFEQNQTVLKKVFTVIPVCCVYALHLSHFKFFYHIQLNSIYEGPFYLSVISTVFIILLVVIQFYYTISNQAKRTLQQVLKHYPLTQREIEIVSEVMEGKTNADIATTLYIEECTVKIHLKHIFKKLGVKRKTELMAFVIKN